MEILMLIYVLIFIIFVLVAFAVLQVNQILDGLYEASKRYEKMSRQEQIVFLMEAEKVFSAFDKIPNILWEDEYQKYSQILDIYKDIKVASWSAS